MSSLKPKYIPDGMRIVIDATEWDGIHSRISERATEMNKRKKSDTAIQTMTTILLLITAILEVLDKLIALIN